jgi:coproporphyrinogen III oxidase-like Fe-S oxidoreductase
LDRAEYRQRFGTEIFADYRQIIAQYQNSGYLKLTPRYLKLSDQALLVSNHILKDFV